MVDVQDKLSPTLAALLLKELRPEEMPAAAAPQTLDKEGERVAMARFFAALEEHRLELRSEPGCEVFCGVVLGYLEALLDPGRDVFVRSGIEMTASCGTLLWTQMTDVQRSVLRREAAVLHAIIKPIADKRF